MYDDLVKKVMIVEDDPVYRKNLASFLFHEFTVVEAEDGESAIEKFLVHKPDVIVLDLLLPKLDGLEVLSRLRNYPDPTVANIPVIILSNFADNEKIIATQKLKISGYYVKSSTSLEEVLRCIKQIVYFGKV